MAQFSCVICFDDFYENQEILSTDCGHIYHSECLGKWFDKSRSCPECRGVLRFLSWKRIYPKESEESRNVINSLESALDAKNKELEKQKKLIKDLLDRNKKLENELKDFQSRKRKPAKRRANS